MRIAYYNPLSLIDFPKTLSCVVFTDGCNLKCPFCQNPELVNGNFSPLISEDDFFIFLKSRKTKLKGVVITGGEPTIHKDLKEFIKKIKQEDFKVKLDTNGVNPLVLKTILDLNLVDYVAMDIKGPLYDYSKFTGLKDPLNTKACKVKESMEYLINSNIDFELRTTLVPGLLSEEELLKIPSYFSSFKVRYVIQNFNPYKTLSDELKDLKPFSSHQIKSFEEKIQKIFPNLIIEARL